MDFQLSSIVHHSKSLAILARLVQNALIVYFRIIERISGINNHTIAACVATSSIVQQKADDIFNETNTFARLRSQLENRQNASGNEAIVNTFSSSWIIDELIPVGVVPKFIVNSL